MIKEVIIGSYLDTSDRTINKQVRGNGLVCFSPIPDGTKIYFNDEENYQFQLYNNVPIYKDFSEFTIIIPATQGYSMSSGATVPDIKVVVFEKPDCICSNPFSKRYNFQHLYTTNVDGYWLLMPRDGKEARLSIQEIGNSNEMLYELRSFREGYISAQQYDSLGYLYGNQNSNLKDNQIIIPCVKKLYFYPLLGSGFLSINMEIYT